MTNKEYDALWLRPDGLHLTGEKRTIAIIDQPLWIEHTEYASQLESVIYNPKDSASMHGAAVVSIAVGSTIGVAPNARVVYRAIETWHDEVRLENHAKALQDLRDYVKNGNNLDCISTSVGWQPEEDGVSKNNELIDWFEERNIPVFSANDLARDYFYTYGPKGPAAYRVRRNLIPPPGTPYPRNMVAIPIDDRLLACRSPQHVKDNGGLLHYRTKNAGESWAVPFVAGCFALAREADPTITRQKFIHVLLETAMLVDFGNGYSFPVADVKALCKTMEVHPERRYRKKITLINTHNI